jgi:predicted nucleic acid-binding protein
MRAPIVDMPVLNWMPRAFEISVAHSVTIYESVYVALAEQRDIPLVNADERLIRRIVIDTKFRKLMIWVGDLAP